MLKSRSGDDGFTLSYKLILVVVNTAFHCCKAFDMYKENMQHKHRLFSLPRCMFGKKTFWLHVVFIWSDELRICFATLWFIQQFPLYVLNPHFDGHWFICCKWISYAFKYGIIQMTWFRLNPCHLVYLSIPLIHTYGIIMTNAISVIHERVTICNTDSKTDRFSAGHVFVSDGITFVKHNSEHFYWKWSSTFDNKVKIQLCTKPQLPGVCAFTSSVHVHPHTLINALSWPLSSKSVQSGVCYYDSEGFVIKLATHQPDFGSQRPSEAGLCVPHRRLFTAPFHTSWCLLDMLNRPREVRESRPKQSLWLAVHTTAACW